MAKNEIYKITILDWEKYNKGNRKHLSGVVIPRNLTTNHKVLALSVSARWCFFAVLMECLSESKGVLKVSLSSLKAVCKLRSSVRDAVFSLEQNQLVTIEILNPINISIQLSSEVGKKDSVDNDSQLVQVSEQTTILKKLKNSDCQKFETKFNPLFQTIKNWSEENNFKFKDSVVAKLVLEYKTEESFSSWLNQFQASPKFKQKPADEQLRFLAGTLVKIANGDE